MHDRKHLLFLTLYLLSVIVREHSDHITIIGIQSTYILIVEIGTNLAVTGDTWVVRIGELGT